MKLKINDRIREVMIAGDEAWLAPIYELFPNSKSRISGNLAFTIEGERRIMVKGHLSFVPMLACSRCTQSVPWKVEPKFEVLFLDPPEGLMEKADYRLGKDELEHYYFEDDAMDLAMLINDQIQEAIPDQVLVVDDTGQFCLPCGADISDEVVYAEDVPEPESPFAVLKGFKDLKQ